MASKNEKAAAKAGKSLKEYKASKKKEDKKSSSKKSSSKDEKKAKKQVEKYYGEKKEDVVKKAEIDTKRLQEDLATLIAEAGLAKTRATEDYIRNVANIEANKGLDVQQLNDYVTTNRGRTQEDLDTALAKETRRFAIESDRINNALAESGLTFSERTPEKLAKEDTTLVQEGITREASRSFADIARYEAAKNADIQLRYGQQLQSEETGKVRTLEDILNEQADKERRIQRGEEDVAFGKAIDLRELDYGKNDAVSTIGNYYDSQRNSLQNNKLLTDVGV